MELFDPMKKEMVNITKENFPKGILGSRILGSSQGWVVFVNPTNNTTISLTNLFHPAFPHDSHKIIQLPLLDDYPVVAVRNVSLSTCFPDTDQNCIVAVKFRGGSYLSFCRPAHDDSSWTNLKTLDTISSTSSLIYSAITGRFYMTFNVGHSIGAWKLNKDTQLPSVSSFYKNLRFSNSNFPKMLESDSCYNISEHLVRSPSPFEYFLIYWYIQASGEHKDIHRTKRIMVFRVDIRSGKVSYTQDIGNRCIFLGDHTEAFCLSATQYPGLIPNSIYFICQGIGVFDLATGLILDFTQENNTKHALVWLPPISF